MADKKYDWSETDRVMEELRRQLAAEHELIAGVTAPGIADVLAEAEAASLPEAEVADAHAPDEPDEVLSAHTVPHDISEEALDSEAPPEELSDVAPTEDAPAPEAVVEDIPTPEAPAETLLAEETPLVDATVLEEPVEEPPVEATPTLDEPAPAQDTPTSDVPAKKKRKRKRVPRLSEIAEKSEDAPLFEEARESAKRRAAELAEAEDSDLFWRRTPKGRVSRSKTADVKKPSPTEASPVPEAPAIPVAEEKGEPAAPVRVEAPEITQMEIPLDLPKAAEAEADTAPRTRRAKRIVPPIAEVEQLTVESLLSDIFGSAAVWSEAEVPDAALPAEQGEEGNAPSPEVAQVTRVRAPEDPIIEIDGKPVLLPDEQALAAAAREKRAVKKAAEDADAVQAEPAAEEKTATEEELADLPPEERVKLFSAFSVRRNKEGALPKPSIAPMSAKQVAFKRRLESSEADFKLLVDLDYEDELGEAIGFEKIREYHERVVNGRTKEASASRTREKGDYEYTSHSLDVKISHFYSKQRRRHIINLTVGLVMMILLFVFERSVLVRELFGSPYGGFAYAPSYIVVGLTLFLALVVLLRKPLFDGIVRLCRLTPSDYSLSAVVVVLSLVYHVFLFFAPSGSSMRLFLSPAAASLLLIALSDFFNWHRESCAFRVVSSKYPKYALMTRVSVGNREGDAKRRLFESEQGERMLYVRPVNFVRNYFANTRKKADHHRSFGAEMLLVTAISFVFALFTVVFGNDLSDALHIAYVTFLITAPVLTTLATSMPMVTATWLCLKRTGAIVGESAVYECGGKTALVLPDDECFKPMPHEQFELVKNCDAERTAILIRALLERIGSQLVHSVDVPEELRLPADAVTLTDIDEHGVAAVVAGERKTPILLGDVAYLQRYGIRVAPKKDGRYEELCRNMLCVAIGNRLTALFIARYRAEDGMRELLEATDAEGVRLVIRTKDPGVHDTLLATLFDGVSLPVRAVKPLALESDIRADYVDASVVAIGSSLEVARTFTVCRRIRRAIRLGKVWQLLAIFVGALLAGALTFFGRLAAVPAYLVVAYNLCWCGVHAISSLLFLRRGRDEE